MRHLKFRKTVRVHPVLFAVARVSLFDYFCKSGALPGGGLGERHSSPVFPLESVCHLPHHSGSGVCQLDSKSLCLSVQFTRVQMGVPVGGGVGLGRQFL